MERPEHLLTPNPLLPITSHFCLFPTATPPRTQNGRHVCIIVLLSLNIASQ